MRLCVDERARVPFALVAVVLLLGSATLAATMHARPADGADPDADAAVDRAVSGTRTALVAATERAARAAARDPVVDRANTTYGRVLDEEEPFRDYLSLRVYLAARRALAATDQRVRSVRVQPSLPPIESPEDARRAIDRVTVERGTSPRVDREKRGLRVRVRNVTVTVTRDGRRIARENRTFTLHTRTPVLAAHDRVEAFEASLNRAAGEGPGLGLRLTGRLYAVVWARGYAQYGGAPITNVLANRHVELMTNGAVLAEQAATIGRADPDGEQALRRASLEVGLKDLLAAGDRRTEWADYVIGVDATPPAGAEPPDAAPVSPVGGNETTASDATGAASGVPAPDDPVEVSVGDTADLAFGALVSEGGLDGLVERKYAARARLVTAVEASGPVPTPTPPTPGAGWERVDRTRTVERTVRPGTGPAPTVSRGWHEHETYTRRVVERWTVTQTWARDGVRTTTTATATRTVRVGVSVVDEHVPAAVPHRGIERVHERGGPLDGHNLRETPGTAVERLVDDRGGADAVARRAAAGTLDGAPVRIQGETPAGLADWVYADLAPLREEVRNVSVTVPRDELVTSAVPHDTLADRFRERRDTLLSAPREYDSVADKVRVAARAAYLARVQAVLDRRAEAAATTRERLNDSLTERTPFTLEEVANLTERGAESVGDSPERVSRRFTVDAAPSYLTLATVDRDRVPSVRRGQTFTPLAARNHNLFAVPYGSAGDAVTDALFDERGTTSLRTAAGVLERTRAVERETDNATLAERRPELRAAVAEEVEEAKERARRTVIATTAMGRGRASEAVETAFGRWNTTADRALAVSNGSAADAVAATAARRLRSDERARDELATRLRVTFEATEEVWSEVPLEEFSTRVTEGPVNRTASVVKRVAREEIRRVVDGAVENATRRVQRRWTEEVGETAVFAGLPVLPPPLGGWYVTTNVWYVSVEGEYARFTVRTRTGSPADALSYSRDGRPVTVDVDGDGAAERLGTATRVSFTQDTAVLIAVPPGKYGVGERDGNPVETSAGWPDAGPGNHTDGRARAAGPADEGRHAQDDPPVRSGHVPRAADVRARRRRRAPGGVRRRPGGGRGGGRRRAGGRANGPGPRGRRAGPRRRGRRPVDRGRRRRAGARGGGARGSDCRRDGL